MKKREVKPFVDTVIKDTINKISFVTGCSIKSICEDFCSHAFESGLGYELSAYFKRNLDIDGEHFEGNNMGFKFDPFTKDIERISMTLNNTNYDYAYRLAYAMECSVAKVVAYALGKSISDFDFLNSYIERILRKNVDEKRRSLLLDVVRDVNNTNYEEEYSIASLVLYIADEYRRFDDGIDSVLKDAYCI